MSEAIREFEYNEKENSHQKLKWKEIKGGECRRFKWANEPEFIYIIKTDFEDRYMVILEDGFETSLESIAHLSKQQIKDRFKIEL